ncbi:sialate O-acetylesterase [Pontiella sulfatireligans]|nr:sialate O-acetylesterase [Pontiella sulfatireligans]
MNTNVMTAAIALLVSSAGFADVRPAALFADNMVLQRETQAPVWGRADADEKVMVSGSWGETASTKADESGKWSVKLQTPAAGGPYTLTIKGDNTVEIKNVLSGEVWFCSGQSNMDFALNMLAKTSSRTEKKYEPAATCVRQEMETAQDELFRQFEVEKNTSPFESLDALKGRWKASSAANNPAFSATAYFFGRELRKELGVPVGLIKCAWGGTRVEPWIPAGEYLKDDEMAAYFERESTGLKDQISKWNPAKVEERYQAALKRWETTKKGRKPRPASNPKENKQMPATLFNAMVNPVIPYAMKGAIWYQGENNASHNTENYEHNFRAMISAWREHWDQGDFPFYFAQLANFKAPVTEPVEFNGWASICDQQRRTLSLKNTGMAVLNDIGEANDIHPHNKMDVGKRLALWALKHDYNRNVPACSGPLYKHHKIKGDRVIITFDHAGSGLMTGNKTGMADTQKTDEPPKYFQICGKDRQWKWAQAEITGKDTIAVSHPEVAEPAVVRYAWAQNPEAANLYNKEGLPASVFTTEAEIPVNAALKPAAKPVTEGSPKTRVSRLEAGEKQTVVVYGTSLTAVGAWVDQLRAVLEQNYPGQITLINSARGGSNSEWGRKSFDERVIQKKPDTMFIEFAINDAVASRKVSVEKARENLEDMIDRLLAAQPDCKIILMTMDPAVSHHADRRPDLVTYYQMYRDVAKARGFLLIDHYPNWEKLLNEDPGLFIQYVPDGIHPVRDGALQVIMPAMMSALGLKKGKPELNEQTPCWNYLFGMMDKLEERDRKVTRSEYNLYWKQQFAKSDADKDGALIADEYKSAVLFKHIDADNDGTITLEEYLATYAPFFGPHDANSDGKLVQGEIWKVK